MTYHARLLRNTGMGRPDSPSLRSAKWGSTLITAIALFWTATRECPAATLLQVVAGGREHMLTDRDFDFETSVRFESRDFWNRWFGDTSDCQDCVVNAVSFAVSGSPPDQGLWEVDFGAGELLSSGLVDLDVGVFDGASSSPFTTLRLGNNYSGPLLALKFNSQHVASPVFAHSAELLKDSTHLPIVATPGIPGRFEVLEAEYGEDGEVLRFAADFEQFAQSIFGEELHSLVTGRIRYNSTVPIPEPAAASLFLCGIAWAAIRSRGRGHR